MLKSKFICLLIISLVILNEKAADAIIDIDSMGFLDTDRYLTNDDDFRLIYRQKLKKLQRLLSSRREMRSDNYLNEQYLRKRFF